MIVTQGDKVKINGQIKKIRKLFSNGLIITTDNEEFFIGFDLVEAA